MSDDGFIAGLADRIKAAGRLGPLVLISLGLPAVSGILLLGYLDPVGMWLRGHEVVGFWLFVGVAMVCGAFGVLPTAMLCLLGGWAFGFGEGTLAAYLGILLATVLGHWLASMAVGDRLLKLIEDSPKARVIRHALAHGGTWPTAGVITLIRISPLFPFAFTNLMLAAAKVKPAPFVVGTAFGLMPRSMALTYIGSEAQSLSEGSTDDMTLTIMGIVAALVSLIALGILARRTIIRLGNRLEVEA